MNWYIAMSSGYWGRGRTIDAAKRELRLAGGSLRTYLVVEFDEPEGKEPPHVDGMGNTVSYSRGEIVEQKKNGRPLVLIAGA